jgi:two-component system chemotaxis response regulator CheB
MRKIRVMIVEDSAVVRALLAHIIAGDPRLEVCATAASGEQALALLDEAAPDVIAMDIRLPGMDGIECTQRIMRSKPIPIVVVAATIEAGKCNAVPMEALRAGALTVIEKPTATTHEGYSALAEHLCTQLVIMSEVIVIRQHAKREADPEPGRPAGVRRANAGAFKMLGIACSTGGPSALVRLLGSLGPTFPLPILLVQHMTASFVEGFASWLDVVCPFAVTVIKDGCIPVAQAVYMAPADQHLRVESGRLRLDTGDKVSFQRPSGTVLFQSMAKHLGAEALGVVLTGMGDDGASGLLNLREAGGYTLAEDESSAVVYGMPGAAVRLGAICESLPLSAVAPRILELTACMA